MSFAGIKDAAKPKFAQGNKDAAKPEFAHHGLHLMQSASECGGDNRVSHRKHDCAEQTGLSVANLLDV